MPSNFNSPDLPKAVAGAMSANMVEFIDLLRQARLHTSDVQFCVQDARFHDGQELVGRTKCSNGHELRLTLRDLHLHLRNKFFNDGSIVPELCAECAYPGDIPDQKKATVYHRLVILRNLYPLASYVDGFSADGKSMERFNCGNRFADGSAHPDFYVRFDKLSLQAKSGSQRHHCYICGLLNKQLPETKSKTLDMFQGRMKAIAEAVSAHSGSVVSQPRVEIAAGQDAALTNPISTTKTLLEFSCGHEGHPKAIRTSDSYFNANKGGYCRLCLASAGVSSTNELFSVDNKTISTSFVS